MLTRISCHLGRARCRYGPGLSAIGERGAGVFALGVDDRKASLCWPYVAGARGGQRVTWRVLAVSWLGGGRRGEGRGSPERGRSGRGSATLRSLKWAGPQLAHTQRPARKSEVSFSSSLPRLAPSAPFSSLPFISSCTSHGSLRLPAPFRSLRQEGDAYVPSIDASATPDSLAPPHHSGILMVSSASRLALACVHSVLNTPPGRSRRRW